MIEFANKCVSEDQAVELRNIIEGQLYDTYVVGGGEVKGQAVSYLKTEVCGKIRGIGNDFEDLVRALGYNIAEGRNKRGQKALVVVNKELVA